MVCALVLLQAGDLLAANANRTVNLNAQVNTQAKITLNITSINFVDFISDNWDSIPADENPVTITAKARTGSSSTVTLTFLASGDLKSSKQTIPISRVTWTATGNGYRNGTMSKTSAQTVGTWTGSGGYAGTLSFFLDTHVSQDAGTYTSSGTFTLTAP